MMFRDEESIFKLVDKLQRGERAPGGIHEPLDVAPHQGMYCSLSNRRLTALMMYQALHRDVCVKAWCRICNDDTEKFEEANSTRNRGLGVDTRDGDSTHVGAPLFLRAEYVLHELNDLAARRDYSQHLDGLLQQLRARPRATQQMRNEESILCFFLTE